MKKRLLSGIAMIIILIPLFLIGGNYFLIFDAILACLAYKEIADLNKDMPAISLTLGLLSIILIVVSNNLKLSNLSPNSYFPIFFTIISLMVPTIISKYNKNYETKDAFYLIGVVLLLGISFYSFNYYMNINKMILLYLVIITTCNDLFAYLLGTLIGHNHFTKISPNKTIEGTISGLLFGFTAGFIFYLFFIDAHINPLFLIFLTLLIDLSASCGDLFFSKIKREHNIKDFSNLIPGHGGILDRFDSLIFATLVYLLITTII